MAFHSGTNKSSRADLCRTFGVFRVSRPSAISKRLDLQTVCNAGNVVDGDVSLGSLNSAQISSG